MGWGGIAPTLKTTSAASQQMIIDDMYENREIRVYEDYSPTLRSERLGLKTISCAMRGRNPENPMDRTSGLLTEQRLEVSGHPDICNCLTSIQKDCLALEENMIENDNSKKRYRVRKLTPKECWRLMDFTDEDFEKAQAVNSATQLYKQAGNSIVVNVLVAIFGQLFEGCENKYKELVTV